MWLISLLRENLETVIEMCILGLAVMIEIFSLVND